MYILNSRNDIAILDKINTENIEVVKLSREFALQNAIDLIRLHNTIPYQNWKLEQLLSNFDGNRHFKEKWEFSRVLLLSEKMIGFCICFEIKTGLYIHRLAVENIWKKRHVATTLICNSINAYLQKSQKYNLVTVQTPIEKDTNEDLLPFYEKIGFKCIGTKSYPNKTDYVLQAKAEQILLKCKSSNRIITLC